MKINRIVLCLTFFIVLSFSDSNIEKLDEYHEAVCHWLVDTSDSIDGYFIAETDTPERSRTRAELKTSFAVESKSSSEYAIRLRLRLNLPKLQKKMRLVFEDEDSDNALYDGTSLDSENNLKNKNYYLRVEYFNYIKDAIKFSGGAGVKIRKSSLHPYFNIKAKREILNNCDYEEMLTNRFRLYIDGDIEDTITWDSYHYFSDEVFLYWSNSFQYQSWEDYQKIVNDISVSNILQKNRQLRFGASLISEMKDDEIKVEYPQLYSKFRDNLYKEWVYYELNPSLLWRKENNYVLSARFMVNIGTIFRKD